MSARIYGEIPGFRKGSFFKDRAELHSSGVHRPLMAGISGSASEAADSIVLSGGYEDDQDYGDVIVYTGQGGNNPTNKKQVYDQELVRGNLALVLNMMEGLPVRVVRGAKHDSPHSPKVGYSYDGLYRVEDYWHDIGRSGFRIWRFRMVKIGSLVSPLARVIREEHQGYNVQPERKQVSVARIIRNTVVATKVKQLHDFICQVCGLRLETPGGPYAEAAHIRPLGAPHNGPDTADNILCLCPNDHLLFDMGAITIDDDLRVIGTQSRLRTVTGHQINMEHIRYHREHYGNELDR